MLFIAPPDPPPPPSFPPPPPPPPRTKTSTDVTFNGTVQLPVQLDAVLLDVIRTKFLLFDPTPVA